MSVHYHDREPSDRDDTPLTADELTAELRAIAEQENAGDRDMTPHYDTGPCGRDVCPVHGTEVDAFGMCGGCEEG